jgi:hypothetical protein
MEDDVKHTDDEVGEPLGDAIDLSQWEPQAPPSDFADRVVERIRVVERRPLRRRRPRWGIVGGATAAMALAAALLLQIGAPLTHGKAIAKERTEVLIGGRAVAVLEPGAELRWDGDDVVQSHGDAFYRVEPGKRFTVHTPAGDVAVKGTCFSVKVRAVAGREGDEDPAMVKRDVKAGVIGAALSSLAFVVVYEGKVAVSHASSGVELRAGESAQASNDGVKRLGADGAAVFEANAAALASADDPLGAANKNLVRQVSDYRSRLESVIAQKTELETKLKRSEDQLAAAQDGSSAAWRSPFDLSQDDWKALVKDGTIKYQIPCFRKTPWSPTPDNLHVLGLAPQDGVTIRDAYARSNERVWSQIKPLCAQAVGSAELAERIGVGTCIHLVLDIEQARDSAAVEAAAKSVGEIRAGMRAAPGPGEPSHPVTKLFLATTGEEQNIERDLAQSFGPDEAHRILFSDEMCMQKSTFGGLAAPTK